ncbi:tetratricopeptide repeat protein [uncultured Tenacibaculum sp.]|uniref:tetratricopeptide repeat protein n=1 Tax=uncultured Tenacibaculum sp. TaxID=174713 RepID=UPI0026318A3A|nr:tetratricopeptide repeat protein [uncultured Tenacibaculum sp.]
MATYKKRGYKPKKEKVVEEVIEDTFDESQSDVAKTFEGLDEVANKSEQWIEKNSRPLFFGLVGIAVLILGYLAFNKFVGEPNEVNASNELAYPRSFFDQAEKAAGAKADSLYNLGLNGGADGKFGFLDIAKTFSGTKAGNIANYYAGITYLRQKDYQNAISYLSDFSSDDELLGPTALGAIGDAFADINQPEEALEYYEKAANKKDNEFTTPMFLFKAGQTAMKLGKHDKALAFFTTVKEKYSTTQIGRDIDKYLNSAKYAK